jgi:hypothetical protein
MAVATKCAPVGPAHEGDHRSREPVRGQPQETELGALEPCRRRLPGEGTRSPPDPTVQEMARSGSIGSGGRMPNVRHARTGRLATNPVRFYLLSVCRSFGPDLPSTRGLGSTVSGRGAYADSIGLHVGPALSRAAVSTAGARCLPRFDLRSEPGDAVRPDFYRRRESTSADVAPQLDPTLSGLEAYAAPAAD